MSEEKGKRRLRFTFEDDVILLREVVSRNPFGDLGLWDDIQTSLFTLTRKHFKTKSLRQHVQWLVDVWSRKEETNEKRSGIEEPYSERDVLLQEAQQLMEVAKHEKSFKQKKKIVAQQQTIKGKDIRTEAATSYYNTEIMMPDHDYVINDDLVIEDCAAEVHFDEPESNATGSGIENLQPGKDEKEGNENVKTKHFRNIMTPIRTRAKRTSYMRRTGLEYLREKNEKELILEEKRLCIEERKVACSERQIALAEKKFDFETENFRKLFNSQQDMMNNLIDVIKDLKNS